MIERTLPQYEPPAVLTYTDEEIMNELGPARTYVSGEMNGSNLLGG